MYPGILRLNWWHEEELGKLEKNKILLHYLDGKLLKGFTWDFFPNKDHFHFFTMENTSDTPVKVSVKELKAIFTVRDFNGNPQYKERREFLEGEVVTGTKLEATFTDGEVMVGTTLGYSPKRQGFYIFPADPKSNNIKVYASCSAVAKVRYL